MTPRVESSLGGEECPTCVPILCREEEDLLLPQCRWDPESARQGGILGEIVASIELILRLRTDPQRQTRPFTDKWSILTEEECQLRRIKSDSPMSSDDMLKCIA